MHKLQTRYLLCALLIAQFISGPAMASENTESISDEKAVLSVLQRYHDALQALTVEGTFELFTADAQVYEQGGVEGTYQHYVDHHLGPELGHFERFTFSDYNADAQILGETALATETYRYTIVTKGSDEKPSRTIEKQGLATSVLVKTEDGWKIKRTHSSSRAIKKK